MQITYKLVIPYFELIFCVLHIMIVVATAREAASIDATAEPIFN